MKELEMLEQFEINELEDRVEFGLCGGSDGGDGDLGGGGCDPEATYCDEPQ